MGSFFHNIGIKLEDKKSLVSRLKQDHQMAYVAPGINGWFLVFPEDGFDMFDLAEKYSSDFNTVVTAALIGDSDDFLFRLYDKGELVFDYELDKTAGKEIEIHKGNAQKLSEYSQQQKDVAKLEEILKKDHYIFEEDRYKEVLKFLDMPGPLGAWGYNYIADAQYQKEIEVAIKEDLPDLEKVE